MSTSFRLVVVLILVLALRLSSAAQTETSKSDAAPSAETVERLVITTTVVAKNGNFSTGLSRDRFHVLIDNEPVEIAEFREEDVPMSVGIVFDASGSVGSTSQTRGVIDVSQQALRTLLETSNRSNEYFLMAFNTRPQLLMDWTSDHDALVNSLTGVSPKGITALYDACYLAIEKVQRGRHPKQVLILISDGMDNNSKYSSDQVRNALKESNILFYAINFSNDAAGSSLGFEGQQILRKLSLLSGGMFFYKKPDARLKSADASSVFEIIATELGHQYTIGINPKIPNTTNKWHKIKVQISVSADAPREMKGLKVRTREGFYFNHR